MFIPIHVAFAKDIIYNLLRLDKAGTTHSSTCRILLDNNYIIVDLTHWQVLPEYFKIFLFAKLQKTKRKIQKI